MHSPTHLVCLFCVTSGQNGENLGSDEEQIVLVVYAVYDVASNQVVALQQHHVRPIPPEVTEKQQEAILTEECKIQTGLSEEAIKNAMPLHVVLEEFDRFMNVHQLHTDQRTICLCTDGQLHLRMCLIPEATNKNIDLPHYFFTFFDLRKEFKKFYKTDDKPVNCLNDMMEFLEMEPSEVTDYGVKQCHEMSALLHRIISEGHVLHDPDHVKDKLEPGVCGKDEIVDDETVVRARGLPWQSSDQDIARFFRGLNVEKGGVALCLSPQGRRNGEALIRFEAKEHRDLALRKHKHHIGSRYIEVYRATGEDFIAIAGGSSTEAQEFLSRHSDGGCQIIVRMRGLPYVCKPEQVLEFFKEEPSPVEVLDGEDGVLFVHQADGRATGDAFVLFSSEEDATKALSKHRQCIGTRYIELFKSTTAEVQQVLNRSLDPRANINGTTPTECLDLTTLTPLPQIIATFPTIQQAAPIIFPHHQQMTAGGNKRDCIVIRGLPFDAHVSDILTFLGEHSKHVIRQGVHLVYSTRGTPSGEAFIQMDSELSAEVACLSRSKKTMYISGGRKNCLEVIQCSVDEMSLFLNSSLPTMIQPRMVNTATLAVCNVAPSAPTLPIIFPSNVPPPPLPPTQQILSTRQMISTPAGGQSFIPSGVDGALLAPTAIYNTTPTNVYSYQPHINQVSFPTPNIIQAAPPLSSLATQTTTCRAPMAAQTNPFQTFQPIYYWYPGPSVSPQNAFYIQTTYPTTVVIKGLPSTVQPHDIMAFLEGQYDIAPDVQMLKTQDGRPSGDAYVTFATRQEAERVIQEHSRKSYGSKIIEMYIV